MDEFGADMIKAEETDDLIDASLHVGSWEILDHISHGFAVDEWNDEDVPDFLYNWLVLL